MIESFDIYIELTPLKKEGVNEVWLEALLTEEVIDKDLFKKIATIPF